jgi:hypothetical protein
MKQSDFTNKAIFTMVVLFIAAAFLVITLPPKHITLKDIPQTVSPLTSPKEPAARENTLINSPETDGDDKVKVECYIIVGTFGNLTQAQQKAEKLINDFNANIIILPPTPEGYFRISYGKYSTIEEARSKIKSIRTNISSDAWIYSVKK